MSTAWNAQLAIGRGISGLMGLADFGLEQGAAALAARTGGQEILTGLYGEVSSESMAMIERAAASEAKVGDFTKLTEAPAVGRSLHVAFVEGGAAAARQTGQ